MKDEVKRYREEMFRIGKAAISAATEQARAELAERPKRQQWTAPVKPDLEERR